MTARTPADELADLRQDILNTLRHDPDRQPDPERNGRVADLIIELSNQYRAAELAALREYAVDTRDNWPGYECQIDPDTLLMLLDIAEADR